MFNSNNRLAKITDVNNFQVIFYDVNTVNTPSIHSQNTVNINPFTEHRLLSELTLQWLW